MQFPPWPLARSFLRATLQYAMLLHSLYLCNNLRRCFKMKSWRIALVSCPYTLIPALSCEFVVCCCPAVVAALNRLFCANTFYAISLLRAFNRRVSRECLGLLRTSLVTSAIFRKTTRWCSNWRQGDFPAFCPTQMQPLSLSSNSLRFLR